MDIFITTLTGTAFELRVNPFESILSIKAKLQQVEGIAISQQHLIWQDIELEDEFCLYDYNIKNGANLQLVLAMRGGPINMRKVSVDEPSALRDVTDLIDKNKDGVWDQLMNDDKQVTLLVFRDGEQLNFFRVYDRGDGTVSPFTGTISAASVSNDCDDSSIYKERQAENCITKDKMKALRENIQVLKESRHVPKPPTTARPTIFHAPRKHSGVKPSSRIPTRCGVLPKTESKMNNYNITTPTPTLGKQQPKASLSNKKPLPPVPSTASRRKPSSIDSTPTEESKVDYLDDTSPLPPRINLLPSLKDAPEVVDLSTSPVLPSRLTRQLLRPLGSVNKHEAGEFLSELRSPGEVLDSEEMAEFLKDPADFESYKKLMKWVQQPNKYEDKWATSSKKLHRLHSVDIEKEKREAPSLKGKKKARCTTCSKKLGLATTYSCRCGNKFCSIHRYPETHTCTFDYKAEGRRLLAKSNPPVLAPKLPKI